MHCTSVKLQMARIFVNEFNNDVLVLEKERDAIARVFLDQVYCPVQILSSVEDERNTALNKNMISEAVSIFTLILTEFEDNAYTWVQSTRLRIEACLKTLNYRTILMDCSCH